MARSGAIEAGSSRNPNSSCGLPATCISRSKRRASRALCLPRCGLARLPPPRGPGLGSEGSGSGSLRSGRSGMIVLFFRHWTADAGRPEFKLLLCDLGRRPLAGGKHLTASNIEEELLRLTEAHPPKRLCDLRRADPELEIAALAQRRQVGSELLLRWHRQRQAK